jgi:orotidine-5'-phosphate decarboxylase
VTVLTSHSGAELEAIGLGGGGGGDTASLVERLATVAHEAGLDGVVCAPSEAARLRQRFGENFLLVTPGIRPSGSNEDDQHRTATPATARHAGADYLVVGRPITRAPDPLAALDAVRREIGEI